MSVDLKYFGRIKSHGRRKKTEAIIVHHTDGNERSTVDGVITTLNTRTDADGNILYLGYHYVIGRDGTVYQLADDDSLIYHSSEANSTTIGVSLVGVESNITDTQVRNAVDLVRRLQIKYNLPNTSVYSHGEIEPKLMATFNRRVGGKAPDEGRKVTNQVRAGQTTPPSVYDAIVAGRGSAAFSGGGDRDELPERFRYALVPTGEISPTASITPYIASLESFHPKIQYELTRRRRADKTVSTHMPFVKLTSLVSVLPENLSGVTDAWCPSLGIHGEDDVSFDDIYLPQDKNGNQRSVVGYATAYVPGSESEIDMKRVAVVVKDSAVNVTTQTMTIRPGQENTDPIRVPIPGITEVNAERNTAGPMGIRGGLMKVDLKIAAYTVGQVDTLLRYYLRPGTRVVLEWGRRSSDPTEEITPYNWKTSKDVITSEFTALIKNPTAQSKFIEDYIYSNFGNYEIFIGYVVKFDLKYNKSNVYEISLTIHSVQQFEIPTIQSGVRSFCANAVNRCNSMDVREYFDSANSWKPNSFNQLMSTEVAKKLPADGSTAPRRQTGFGDNFFPIKNNQPGTSGAGSSEAGLDETEYFVSWQFFVDKILNDPNRGVISVFPHDVNEPSAAEDDPTKSQEISTQQMLKLGFLRPVSPPNLEDLDKLKTNLIANEVGYHPALRSVDPNVMIIWNDTAQKGLAEDEKQNYRKLVDASVGETGEDGRTDFNNNGHIVGFITKSSIGSFKNILEENQNQPGSGLLTNGIWLNTKAIKQAFSSTDTVSSALNALLSMMNAATQGYWNLQLLSVDRQHSGLFVVDMGLSKRLEKTTPTGGETSTSTNDVPFPWIDREEQEPNNPLRTVTGVDLVRYQKSATDVNKPRYIYMFNRGTKLLDDGNQLGSDLLDLNVEFNLPQVIAVQAIAGVGGPAQKSTLQSIDLKELNDITLIKKIFSTCDESDVCLDEPCNAEETNLRSLQSRFDAAKTATTTAQRAVDANPNATGSLAEDLQKQLETAKNNELAARDDFYAADISRRFGNSTVIDTARELSSLGTALELVEFNAANLLRKLNIDSTNEQPEPGEVGPRRKIPPVHAFNSSNLTKTTVTVTLPGIGGIELFQSFLVDRVPSILDRGFYVVTKVSHKFGVTEGWITTIEGRFRFRPNTEDLTPTSPESSPCTGTPVRTTSPGSTPAVERRGSSTGVTGGSTATSGTPITTSPANNGQAIADRRNNYVNRIRAMSSEVLREEFDYLENNVELQTFGLVATRDRWLAKFKSGQVALEREKFELVKAEIRNRIQNARSTGQIIPEPLRFTFPNTALAPKQWDNSIDALPGWAQQALRPQR